MSHKNQNYFLSYFIYRHFTTFNLFLVDDSDNSAMIGITVAALISLLLVVAYFATYFTSKNKLENRNRPRPEYMSPSQQQQQYNIIHQQHPTTIYTPVSQNSHNVETDVSKFNRNVEDA